MSCQKKHLESHSFSFSFYKQTSSFFSSSNLSSHSLLFHFQILLLPLHSTGSNHALLFLCMLSHCNPLLLSLIFLVFVYVYFLLYLRFCTVSIYVFFHELC